MEHWFVRKMEVGIEVIIATLPIIINLPIFHHSNIPSVSCPPPRAAQRRRAGRSELI
jgi:hypothetical protein